MVKKPSPPTLAIMEISFHFICDQKYKSHSNTVCKDFLQDNTFYCAPFKTKMNLDALCMNFFLYPESQTSMCRSKKIEKCEEYPKNSQPS